MLPAEVILYFSSLHHIGAGLAEVLLFLYPMWVVLITAVVLRTPVSRLVVLCSAGAVGGAALTVGAVEGVDLVGVVLAVGASIGFACYVVLSGRLVHGMGALVTTAVVVTGAGLTFTVLALATAVAGPDGRGRLGAPPWGSRWSARSSRSCCSRRAWPGSRAPTPRSSPRSSPRWPSCSAPCSSGSRSGSSRSLGVVVVLASVAVLLRGQPGTDPVPPTLEH